SNILSLSLVITIMLQTSSCNFTSSNTQSTPTLLSTTPGRGDSAPNSTQMSNATRGRQSEQNTAFEYDYVTLRLWGLVAAGVLTFLGILILIAHKPKCSRHSKTFIVQEWNPTPRAQLLSMRRLDLDH
ncbi:phospholemman-like, partial [Huso huso]